MYALQLYDISISKIMLFRIAADTILLLHLSFIIFAILGALLAFRWRWMPFVHLPAAAWGVVVELTGRICPLTYLENHFRQKAGQAGYDDSFIEHYLLNIIYPAGLTQEVQYFLGGFVLVINVAIYSALFRNRRRNTKNNA